MTIKPDPKAPTARVERFATQAEAVAYAREASRHTYATMYVVESPVRDDPDIGRWCVDTSDLIRNFERLEARFERGREVDAE
jgi:hypothetical protein